MSRSRIEWTEEVWNPVRGCSRVSEGCRNCYAEQIAARFNKPAIGEGRPQAYHGLAVMTPAGPRWTGEIRFDADTLLEPLGWKRPRRVFVNSMSDLFHEKVTDSQLCLIFAVMALAPEHTFQILTKRPQRMREFLSRGAMLLDAIEQAARMIACREVSLRHSWPLPNVWLGVSVENQAAADERVPELLQTPAAVRWISAEPLLGHVSLEEIPTPSLLLGAVRVDSALGGECWGDCACDTVWGTDPGCRRNGGDGTLTRKIDWVVVGGESGQGARPMHPEWALSLREQCAGADVPFFFKQWGMYRPVRQVYDHDWEDDPLEDPAMPWDDDDMIELESNGMIVGGYQPRVHFAPWVMRRCRTKKQAGRLLDGREYNEYPGALVAAGKEN